MAGFAIDLALVLPGKIAGVFGHVLLFVVLESPFTVFKAGSSRRQLVVLDAIRGSVDSPRADGSDSRADGRGRPGRAGARSVGVVGGG